MSVRGAAPVPGTGAGSAPNDQRETMTMTVGYLQGNEAKARLVGVWRKCVCACRLVGHHVSSYVNNPSDFKINFKN